MFFRSLTFVRFSEAVAESLAELETHLAEKRLRPCGPLDLSTTGFVSPHGRHEEALTHRVGNFLLVAIGEERKILPSGVLKEALAERLRKIAETEDRQVGAKERKQIKEDVLTELLPRAFVDYKRTFAYLDLRGGWLVCDTATAAGAEKIISELRDAVGTFPVEPACPEESPRTLLTDWAMHGKLPAGLALGEEVELRDPAEGGGIVRCRRQDLETDEVREHLKTGKQVFKLGLTFDDRISFVLGEDLAVRKLRFLDVVLDELGNSETDSASAKLDARMALMTLEVERLLNKLDEWFGLPRPEDR
jgi:recombination associated protein RdgC